MDESLYDLAGAGEYLDVTTRKLRDLCRDKRISHSRIDYDNRFSNADLEEFLDRYKFRRRSVYDS